MTTTELPDAARSRREHQADHRQRPTHLSLGLRAQQRPARHAVQQGDELPVEFGDGPRLVDRGGSRSPRCQFTPAEPDRSAGAWGVRIVRIALCEMEREGVPSTGNRIAQSHPEPIHAWRARGHDGGGQDRPRPYRGSTRSTTPPPRRWTKPATPRSLPSIFTPNSVRPTR